MVRIAKWEASRGPLCYLKRRSHFRCETGYQAKEQVGLDLDIEELFTGDRHKYRVLALSSGGQKGQPSEGGCLRSELSTEQDDRSVAKGSVGP